MYERDKSLGVAKIVVIHTGLAKYLNSMDKEESEMRASVYPEYLR